MHQRFPAGEDNPLHSKLPKSGEVRFKVTVRNLSGLTNAPDITHHATAIAAVMRRNNQNGKVRDPMLSTWINGNAGRA
jgi:hypothetical protein